MIIYDFMCAAQHRFEGWFKNAEDYRQQFTDGLLACPLCGSEQVQKLPTASHVSTGSLGGAPQENKPVEHQLQSTEFLKKLHDYVEQNYDDVGNRFTEEAKKIHCGEIEERNIRGQATKEQVKELREEGIKTFPLPPKPVDKDKLN